MVVLPGAKTYVSKMEFPSAVPWCRMLVGYVSLQLVGPVAQASGCPQSKHSERTEPGAATSFLRWHWPLSLSRTSATLCWSMSWLILVVDLVGFRVTMENNLCKSGGASKWG